MKSRATIGRGPGTWTARPCAAGVPMSFRIASAASSLRMAVAVHISGKDQGSARGFRGREGILREERDDLGPLGVRDRRRMDDDVDAADRFNDGFPDAKVRRDNLDPRREARGSLARTNDGADLMTREARSAHDGASDQSPRTEDHHPHAPRTIAAAEKDDAFDWATCLRARCMHEPGLCRPCDRRRKARFGEVGEVWSMRTGIKLGPRAAA